MVPDAPIPPELLVEDAERPYVEVFDGAPVAKPVSPVSWHGQIAGRLCAVVDSWAGDRGVAGVEIRHHFIPPEHAPPSSLLPDVSFTSYVRLEAAGQRDEPAFRIAPDLAVEIRSSNERPSRLARRVALYVEFGARAVIVVDPPRNEWTLHTRDGRASGSLAGTLHVPGFNGLAFEWARVLRGVTITPVP